MGTFKKNYKKKQKYMNKISKIYNKNMQLNKLSNCLKKECGKQIHIILCTK